MRLDDNEFNNWWDRQNLSEQARKVVQLIRSSEPSRRVSGGGRSVSGNYPSLKMGVSVQFELCNTLSVQRLQDKASIVVNALHNDIQACKQY